MWYCDPDESRINICVIYCPANIGFKNWQLRGQQDEVLLLHLSLHPVCEDLVMGSVLVEDQVEGVVSLAAQEEALGEEEGHHKMELEA